MNFVNIKAFYEAGLTALGQYFDPERYELLLLYRSENVVFLISESGCARPCAVIRVSRPGYHTPEEIEAELIWVLQLADEGKVKVARPLRTLDGALFTKVTAQGIEFTCAAFSFLEGINKKRLDTTDFREAGRITALLHDQVIHWDKAGSLKRPHWDYKNMLGENALFGDWRQCTDLDEKDRVIIGKTCDVIKESLDKYGRNKNNYGLIHSDLRASNFLIDENVIQVTDFDDCGFGWFMYDAAGAVSFLETDDKLEDYLTAWFEGYRTLRNVSKEDLDEVPVFIMARRIQLMAWISCHEDSDPVRDNYSGFAKDTVSLAERFLKNLS